MNTTVKIKPMENCEFPDCEQSQQTWFQRDDGSIIHVCLSHKVCMEGFFKRG